MIVTIHMSREAEFERALEDCEIKHFTVEKIERPEMSHYTLHVSAEKAFELGLAFAIQTGLVNETDLTLENNSL